MSDDLGSDDLGSERLDAGSGDTDAGSGDLRAGSGDLGVGGDDLDALSTDELRQRALAQAEARHDRRFLWDLVTHMRSSAAIAGEDASSGGITGSIAEAVAIVRELRGSAPLGEDEPLLRARFLDYLRSGN